METLYRKYRPKKFSEIVGQEHVKRILTRAIEEGRISHAYIFAGPRGTGKTTTARILAKALNCENRQGAEPCGECYACRSIDDGTFMDVVELDAASNRGIDEIRRIKEGASFRPIEGKYKVYIIDEVHMLTREAFNALLKTLEEPPPHVVFVLATTNLEKVPPTIVSRCQVLEFRNLPDDLIVERLKEVCEREGIEISDEALRMIAKRSMGGMRDALTILEQVWKFSGGKAIEVKDVEDALGLVRSSVVEDYLEGISEGDLDRVKEVVNEVYRSGKELDVLVQEAVEMAVEEAEKGDRRYVSIARELLSALRDIKTFENKRVYLMAFSLSLAQKFSSNRQSVVEEVREEKREEKVRREEDEETAKEEKRTESEGKTGPSEILPLLNYLKERGDLAVFVALSLADEVKKDGEKLRIVFHREKEFSYTVLKERILELEDAVRKTLGSLEIEVTMEEETERSREIRGRLLSLFGEEG